VGVKAICISQFFVTMTNTWEREFKERKDSFWFTVSKVRIYVIWFHYLWVCDYADHDGTRVWWMTAGKQKMPVLVGFLHLLLFHLGPQPMGCCRSHSGQIFPLQLITSGNALTEICTNQSSWLSRLAITLSILFDLVWGFLLLFLVSMTFKDP
jgi:hypothetical protein